MTAAIEISAEHIVWRDLGYQNSYEPFDQGTVLRDVGPFTFDRSSYTRMLDAFRDGFTGPATT